MKQRLSIILVSILLTLLGSAQSGVNTLGNAPFNTIALKILPEKVVEEEAPASSAEAELPPAPHQTTLTLPSDEELAKLYDPSVPILQGETTLWYALAGAFLGGILLNLMPCVFPVLSLKVLSIVEKAGQETWKVRLHGLLFTAGVIISMWVLALILFAIKASTGEAINWGQQMSYPTVVGAVIIILFTLGLNMAGVFEMGTRLATLGNTAQPKNGYVATLLSGVLTTVIATPCSGPFLGAAMSYTLSQPLLISLGLFTVFALGVAFPYLVLSFFPFLTAALPRPGAWMETLKVILSFGVFAAAAFFMQTFAALTGGAGLSWLIMALVVIALAAYCYGRWSLPHLSQKVRWGLGTALPVLILSIGIFMGWKAATEHEAPVATYGAQGSNKPGEILWYEWKPGIVEYLRSEGYYVWVDYTAEWCFTCKTNKKIVFGNDAFVSSLDQSKIIFVKADMTDRPAILQNDLARAKGRKIIPVNIVYSPSKFQIPELIDDVMTVKDAHQALKNIGY